MAGQIPGPQCRTRDGRLIADGTLARQRSPRPGSLGHLQIAIPDDSRDEDYCLNGDMLLKIAPEVGPMAENVAICLTHAMNEARIASLAGKAMFISQLAYESDGFTRLEEDGAPITYSFGKYQEKEADDKVYEYLFFMYDKDSPSPRRKRVAQRLGNQYAGDGARFRGRGYIQLRGRLNYQRAGAALGLELEKTPEMAATPTIAARLAAWFWQTGGLNSVVGSEEGFKQITLQVSGGYKDLEERARLYNLAKFVLGG